MPSEDGRDFHYLAWAFVTWSMPMPGGNRHVWPAIAVAFSPVGDERYPAIVGVDVAKGLLAEFEDEGIQAVLQHGDPRRDPDGGGRVPDGWSQRHCRSEVDADRFISVAHIEPYGRGESVLLTLETHRGGTKFPISALAADRLLEALRTLIASVT